MLKFIQMFLTIPVIDNIYMCIAFSKVFIERYDITVSCIQSVGPSWSTAFEAAKHFVDVFRDIRLV